MQATSFALSPAQLQSIHAIIATGDEAALAAFELLKTEQILEAESGPAQDLLKELSFKVLEVNREDVTSAFMLLKRKGVFDDVQDEKPPGPPQLTPAQRAALESAERYLEDAHGTMYRLDTLYSEFQNAWTGIGQRKALNKMDSVLSSASSYIDYAKRSIRQVIDVDHPEVARVRAHESEIINRYNSWVNWVNDVWRQFQRM
jgi:hypothetical protein